MENRSRILTPVIGWHEERGTVKFRLADNVARDANACPCWTCPIRAGCEVECSDYVRYVSVGVVPRKRRSSPPT